MLFKKAHLQGIKSGSISLAFRKWKKASIKKGTLLKTSLGLVEIVDITTIEEKELSRDDAMKAGFESKEPLLKSLGPNHVGIIFKIQVRYHSADPRIELREQTLTDEKLVELKEKLARLDKYSRRGNWTGKILHAINDNPHVHAIGIARLTGFEKEWLKPSIRKLKNLGLTISHDVGYELSPLGREFVETLLNEK
ncbi:ASCH domain-containing protein [Pleomorphovibrio marinus]|uniref:hypothetical protein n=1 Tax=Pleomorphovibrio marinus TaxID=2164132 RepID=UPI000E0A0518|nr:hypothetical protein [Pleomorphovibrio marinus]